MRNTLTEAVGMVIGRRRGLSAWVRIQPAFAAAHELISQERTDLRIVCASDDILLDQLSGVRRVTEATISHCWNAIGPTPTPAFRRNVEDNEPNPVAIEEFGLGDLVLKLIYEGAMAPVHLVCAGGGNRASEIDYAAEPIRLRRHWMRVTWDALACDATV